MQETTQTPEPLLTFAWQHGLFDAHNLCTHDARRVEVVRPGRRNPAPGPQFVDAEIRVAGTNYVGAVAVHEKASDWGYLKRNYEAAWDGVVLNVVGRDDRIVRKVDDTVLPSVEIELPERLARGYRALVAGAGQGSCGTYLMRHLTPIEFQGACTRLEIDRLERKVGDVMAIYDSVGKSWHETFHVLFFRSMGLGKNKDIYMSLARNAPYDRLCRERGEAENIEAMLFGVAGLLDPSLYDEYKAGLTRRWDILRERHGLQTMSYCEWSDRGVRPFNFVPKRIAQLASIVNSGDFTFERMLACEEVEDVRQLFRVELPEYWKRSFSFGTRSETVQNTVGEVTIDILVINLIAPILFAYGRQEGRGELEERAIDFLYQTAPEKNRYTEPWRRHGVPVDHALASQAMIQLSTEFCLAKRCTECFLGSRLLKM